MSAPVPPPNDEPTGDSPMADESPPRRGDETEEAVVSVDLHGIKAKIRPADGGVEPKSWLEVAKSINQSLMRICANVPHLVAELLVGATRLCRGLTSLPESIADRIRDGHRKADEREDRHDPIVTQETPSRPALPSGSPQKRLSPPPPTVEVAEQALMDKLAALQAHGIVANIEKRADGRWVIVIVRPELEDTSRQLGHEALDQFADEGRGDVDDNADTDDDGEEPDDGDDDVDEDFDNEGPLSKD